MNAEWHAAHPMPHHVSYEQRVAWHLEHQRHCGCRPLPAGVAEHVARVKRAARLGPNRSRHHLDEI